MDHDKITQTIQKMIADRNARSAPEREKVYAAARAALGRTAGSDPAVMVELETAIAAVEAYYAPTPDESAVTPSSASPASPQGSIIRYLAAAAGSALVGALVAGLIIVAGFPMLLREGQAVRELKQQYDRTLPHLPVAEKFLQKVSDDIIKMQKTDGADLKAKAGDKLVSLKVVDPKLAKEMPSSLPPGTYVIVRADDHDFKILFDWTVCAAARIAKPTMVDPVRDSPGVLGCPYFGIWTAGAARW